MRVHLVFHQHTGVARINGLIWVPDDELDLQWSLLIVAHAGSMGHRGVEATRTALMEKFTWRGISDDVAAFVSNCLQCMCNGPAMVPRPLGEALHAVEPNKLIHCDFLSMPDGNIHVIVDDASRFILLTIHDNCRAQDADEAMQEWFGLFGITQWWMSDQGPHYKNAVVAELQRVYGVGHSFSTPHCPWANGTVEVMKRSIIKTFKTILVELKRPQSEWRSIKNLVMLSLNHTPSSKLSGRAPITAMTQLPAGNALSAYTVDEEVVEITADQLAEWRTKIFVELAEARDNLHRELADGAAKKRDKERKRNNKDKRRRKI
ncbi:hypothetical protein AeRB84_012767 [Aphanomyces euteiches]|nr:hypothetical protein AeRB84_012767 [Aphanomyces euteiches]